MVEYLLTGIFIALSAGLSPGPLMALMISQTIHHGLGEGIKIAIAPILTDIPIIIIITLLVSLFSGIDLFLAGISFLGACYLAYLAYESFKIKGITVVKGKVKPRSLKKGALTNFLNPSVYFFWFTIGGPLLLKSMQKNEFSYGIIFVITFLVTLFLAQFMIVLVAAHSRGFLKSTAYIYVNRFLGLLLLFFAFRFFQEGLHYLK
jgi:threonine/homoserine/homoserine lactone efflux protein